MKPIKNNKKSYLAKLFKTILKEKANAWESISGHAAIICRELKKPCFVGVKNATYFLKGKKVKLNAFQGKIKII